AVTQRDQATSNSIIIYSVKRMYTYDGWGGKGIMILFVLAIANIQLKQAILYQPFEDGLSIHTKTNEGNWKSIKEICPSRYCNDTIVHTIINFVSIENIFRKYFI
ncbi:hypothetical protein COBT_001725, partial [Conglomerata obtusa]